MADGGRERAGGPVHLMKLCVGAETLDDLARWQRNPRAQRDPRRGDTRPMHVTRMWPRRAAEVLDGGSLYWVIRGSLCVRQRILDLEKVADAEGRTRCAILLDPELVKVAPVPRKPFQGWRYLEAASAPPDLGQSRATGGSELPEELEETLLALGLVEK